MKITLVRGSGPLPPESSLAVVRQFLFGLFDGWTETDKSAWRKWWKWLMSLEPGEFAVFMATFHRSTPYHRRHMKIERAVFDAQEKFTDFELFRNWLKVGACWVVWVAGPKGGVVPLPKSVSYREADQVEFEQFHKQVMEFLRGGAPAKLWQHLGDKSYAMMDAILNGFNE